MEIAVILVPIRRLLFLALLSFLPSCVLGQLGKPNYGIFEPNAPGYVLLPVPTSDLILGARLDPVSFDILATGCLTGDKRGVIRGATVIYNLSSNRSVNANLTIQKLFSAQFSDQVVMQVNLIAETTSTDSLINIRGDRRRLRCRLTHEQQKNAVYVTSVRRAQILSYQFFGSGGLRLDFSVEATLKKVFPVDAGLSGRVDNLGNLQVAGKNLIYEVALTSFPARTETVICREDQFCSTGLLPDYQFTISTDKIDEGKIAVIVHDVKTGTEIKRLYLQNQQLGYLDLPDGSKVYLKPTFDSNRFGKADIEFELV